jgi:hypothetical protein
LLDDPSVQIADTGPTSVAEQNIESLTLILTDPLALPPAPDALMW